MESHGILKDQKSTKPEIFHFCVLVVLLGDNIKLILLGLRFLL